MTCNIGINGFGRVGRQLFRATLSRPDIRVVAINDPFLDADAAAHAIKYDSVAGRFGGHVEVAGKDLLIVDSSRIAFCSEPDPVAIPWCDYGVTYVIECSGVFTTAERAAGHLAGGAQRVLIATSSADAPPIVLGANGETYQPSMQVFSAGSCTATVIAPILKTLHTLCGVAQCSFTSIHSATGGHVTDTTNMRDLRGSRASLASIVPITTGAVQTLTKVLPKLRGVVTGTAVRVPTASVSLLDITLILEAPVTKSAVLSALASIEVLVGMDSNEELQRTAESALESPQHSAKPIQGSSRRTVRILGVTHDPVVSTDFIGEKLSGVIDATASVALPTKQTPTNAPTQRSTGGLAADDVPTTHFKLIVWYDNESGYAERLVDLVCFTNAVWVPS